MLNKLSKNSEQLKHVISSNWEHIHSTNDWQVHFQTLPFDYERYEQMKNCFDSFMDKNEEDKENYSNCIFPTLKQITVDFDIPLKTLKPIHT